MRYASAKIDSIYFDRLSNTLPGRWLASQAKYFRKQLNTIFLKLQQHQIEKVITKQN